MLKRLSVVFGLALVTACGGTSDEPMQLDWETGEQFHISASYRVGAVMTEESTATLEGETSAVFDEQWTENVIWTFQVVETGLVPQSGDELYPYAVTHKGVTSLAVIRAYMEDGLNSDEELLDSDPVIYLVFREDRDRLAAVISFTYDDGERVSQAWSSTELGRSWSVLSQSMLTSVPTYMAPFGVTVEDKEMTLENGSYLSTYVVDDDVVDAVYEDEFGGGLIGSRYEVGQPWPTWTLSENLDARLLSDTDLSNLRANQPYLAPEAPEDFDYRAALKATIDIDAALVLDEQNIQGFDASAYDDYLPWAGSWWPQSKGDLVFGYDGRDTISDRIKEDIDPIKTDMDKLSKDIRDMDSGDAKDEIIKEYRDKQKELVDMLVEFYKGVLSDLDGGQLIIADGKVTHADGWSYELDELSPMDKYAVTVYAKGETYPNPFYIGAWELLNHYSPAGGSWWGHCNGWAAAAILTKEPTESIDTTVDGQTVEYTSADIKGLLSESHYSTYSSFYGERYNDENDDITDLTPAAFHKLISFYIRDQHVSLVFDTTAGDQVWNYPAYAADVDITETTPEGQDRLVNVNTADAKTLATLPGIGEELAKAIIDHREYYGPFQSIKDVTKVRGIGSMTMMDIENLIIVKPAERTFSVVANTVFATDAVPETHIDTGTPKGFTKTYRYTLVTDQDGLVLSGKWYDDKEHPDFAWIPYVNPTRASSGGSENPYLSYATLLEIIGDDFVRK